MKPLIFLENEGFTPVISGREQSGNNAKMLGAFENQGLRFFVAAF